MNLTPNVTPPSRGSRRQPEASRSTILAAALAEFAAQGLAGARMDAIAVAAGVNKALLYYYFRSKDELYSAVLEEFFRRLQARISHALDSDASPSERILLYARAHFDSVSESLHYARLFQREMMSAGREGSPRFSHIVDQYIRPISVRVLEVLRQGIAAGEFRSIDPAQFAPTMAATVVWYFVVSPVVRRLRPGDPYSPKAIQQRRAAVLDFIAAALFVDRSAGLKLAADVAARPADTDIPGGFAATTRAGARRRRK
jgi:TetR/AcrR family transcriptional regulator